MDEPVVVPELVQEIWRRDGTRPGSPERPSAEERMVATDDREPVDAEDLVVESEGLAEPAPQKKGRAFLGGVLAFVLGAGLAGGAVKALDARDEARLRTSVREQQTRAEDDVAAARAESEASRRNSASAQADLDAAKLKATDLQKQLDAANAATSGANAQLQEVQKQFFEYASKYNEKTAALSNLAPPGAGGTTP
ncbi:MAG: hypothetical protein ACOYNI_07550 [Acidimicrobiia bacterium]